MNNLNLLHKKSGFTLIELLVVVSIIGLLSSIVLAALSSAKLKAQDARVISEMSSLRTAAELYYSTYGRYNNVSDNVQGFTQAYSPGPNGCSKGLFSDPTSGGLKIIADIATLNSGRASGSWNLVCAISPTSYVVLARLPSAPSIIGGGPGSTTYICVDSSKKLTTKQGEFYNVASGSGSDVSPYTCS